jgi:hypothetical protein
MNILIMGHKLRNSDIGSIILGNENLLLSHNSDIVSVI